MRSFFTGSLLIFIAVSLVASSGWAASSPKAVVVRIKCQLQGVNSTPNNATTECHGLHGWFDGRLDWTSEGVTLFQEFGPFVGLQSAGEVLIFADGNNNEDTFKTIYEDPSTSIFTVPDLMIRLFVRDHYGQDVLV